MMVLMWRPFEDEFQATHQKLEGQRSIIRDNFLIAVEIAHMHERQQQSIHRDVVETNLKKLGLEWHSTQRSIARQIKFLNRK